MNIFLIGMPGSGKSTNAELLAKKLSFRVFDTDKLIEEKENKTVNQIFEDHGEDYFRRLEHEILKSWAYDECVISTGGGMPCFFDNLLLLHDCGRTIYLKSSVKTLTERLFHDNNRPLLENKTKDEVKNWVKSTLKKRKLYYEKSHLTVNANNQPKDILEEILNNIHKLTS